MSRKGKRIEVKFRAGTVVYRAEGNVATNWALNSVVAAASPEDIIPEILDELEALWAIYVETPEDKLTKGAVALRGHLLRAAAGGRVEEAP